MTLTKKWLMKTIAELEEERDAVPGVVNEDAVMALEAMKRALASLEAEPVAFRSKLKPPSAIGGESWGYTDHRQPDAFELESCVIERLYTAPPAPFVPDEINVLQAANLVLTLGVLDNGIPTVAMKVWNSCRAAMLQGAEHVTTANKLPFEQWLSQQTGTIDVECGCVMTEVFFHWLRVAYEAGNYPVIPDGWVLVPIEPTYQMCEAMGLQWESPRFPDRYKAMLAAVKK
ncbi:hypothetical protein SGI62_002332 [Enterobacter hormaechei]|nr:hypothetical protein [Enterobacter hormaechei]